MSRQFVAAIALALSACASTRHTSDDGAFTKSSGREVVAEHPAAVKPATGKSAAIWNEAMDRKGTRVVISTKSRSLWIMKDSTVTFRAPIAVGRTKPLNYKGKHFNFATPVGKRTIHSKATSPLWVPPDWHYYQIAHDYGVEPVFLKKTSKVKLSDGTRIEVRKNQVGRVNRFGNFWPFTPGKEIMYDGKVFVPPIGTAQRQIPHVLGTHKLDMGNAYLIHGTNEDDAIGDVLSFGCIRMYNEDVAKVYAAVPVGTPIYIY
jgi:hypothetical protein